MTEIVIATSKNLCCAVVRDQGVQRAAMGTVVAIGVAIAKFTFFGSTAA